MFKPQSIPEVILVTPKRFGDERGYFSETFQAARYAENGIDVPFIQDNHSLSRPAGVLRGLHFQIPPRAQDKLVRCTRGKILDVAVDIRVGSPSFGRHVAVELTAENGEQLFVPKGFAHAFCTLTPDCEVQYKTSDYYAPDCDKGLAFDDPALELAWPSPAADLILSEKDRKHPPLSELPAYFTYPG
ncbi:MAG: dTDP-4-dehydrorhamnose 3,5-epimerase [Pseudomonadota bacterium]